MKRLALFICTLLCANLLFSQTTSWFWSGNLKYVVTSTSSAEVGVCDASSSITAAHIPSTVGYYGTNYRVTSIENEAFRDCSSLTSVTIPNSVTSIGESAFRGCSSLTSVTCLGDNPPTIESQAFYSTPNFKTLYVPNSSIANYGNSNWGNYFDNIVTEEGNLKYSYNGNNTLEVIGCVGSYTSIVIPSEVGSCSVTSIGNYAFRNCSSLTSITIPNSVTSVGGGVFYGCYNLTSVTLSNNITSLPSAIEQANPYATAYYYGFFENCSSLTTITIPNSVTSIGEEAFKNCSSLTSVTIGNSLTSIGDSAFANCDNLTSVSLDMSSIPAGLNFPITPLQNLTFGENVTYIASGAFSAYSFLQNVTCLATTPPTLADNTVFPYPNIATLTVPCGTLEAYSSPTSFWNMFFMGRIEEDCNNEGGDSGLEDVEHSELSFYPNPTDSKITFSSTIERIEVIDLIGKVIFTFRNESEINIESLPAGAYYLRLTNEEKTSLQKVIKQ